MIAFNSELVHFINCLNYYYFYCVDLINLYCDNGDDCCFERLLQCRFDGPQNYGQPLVAMYEYWVFLSC